jgi:aminomethyltransferase
MIEFGGWLMPVQYSGIMEEHRAVRASLGVFDISHMGEFFIEGENAERWLNGLLTNNVARLAPGECQYTLLLNNDGGIIDDLIAYRLATSRYLLVVNASKIDEDRRWLEEHLEAGVEFRDESSAYAALAVQGRHAPQLFSALFGDAPPCPPRNHVITVRFEAADCLIARTGYTGEDGFEAFCPAHAGANLWRAVLETGARWEIKPCGLGARDTLRMEMCYPLNGVDLSAQTTPLEAGLSFFVDLQKPAFIGREKLAAQKENGLPRKLVPFKMHGMSPPPRSHYKVIKNGTTIGETTSGSLSPTLNVGIGMTYLPAALARAGEEIEIDIRGRSYAARVEKKPLVRPATVP